MTKAFTANSLSFDSLALSTANLYSAVQPGGSLYGLQDSNILDTAAAYSSPASNWGSPRDGSIGSIAGGVNVFGGGLALYDAQKKVIGGLGVSGDSSCADAHIAWKVRAALALDYVPSGVSGDLQRPDNILYDIDANGKSASGWGHPACNDNAAAIAAALPPIRT